MQTTMKTFSILIVAGVLFAGIIHTAAQTNDVSVASIVTDAFFNGIVDQSDGGCEGRGFYARATFLEALGNYPQFGRVGSEEDSKREIAAFFAHVTHETGHFCFINEINPSQNYCDVNFPQYPCNPSKSYFGRGPLQLTWNYNYAQAGSSIEFDGLNTPEIVATDPLVSFRSALWYWTTIVQPVIGQGFGATIRAINGPQECDGVNRDAVNSRVGYFTDYCNQHYNKKGYYRQQKPSENRQKCPLPTVFRQEQTVAKTLVGNV